MTVAARRCQCGWGLSATPDPEQRPDWLPGIPGRGDQAVVDNLVSGILGSPLGQHRAATALELFTADDPRLREWAARVMGSGTGVQLALSGDTDPRVRAALAATLRPAPNVVRAVAADDDPRVRATVAHGAKHSATKEIAAELARDPHPVVRARALESRNISEYRPTAAQLRAAGALAPLLRGWADRCDLAASDRLDPQLWPWLAFDPSGRVVTEFARRGPLPPAEVDVATLPVEYREGLAGSRLDHWMGPGRGPLPPALWQALFDDPVCDVRASLVQASDAAQRVLFADDACGAVYSSRAGGQATSASTASIASTFSSTAALHRRSWLSPTAAREGQTTTLSHRPRVNLPHWRTNHQGRAT